MADRIVFDVDFLCPKGFFEVSCPDQGGHAAVLSDWHLLLDRKQIAIPPHSRWAGLDPLAADYLLQTGVIVVNLQRPKAELTDMQRLGRIGTAALTAL